MSEICMPDMERIASALDQMRGEAIINIQGDEPVFDTHVIAKMIGKGQVSDPDIFTPIHKFHDTKDALDPNCVKIGLGYNGRALDCSRSVVPLVHDEKDASKWPKYSDFYDHVGILGWKRKILEIYLNSVLSKLEFVEKLEQVRLLQNGYVIDAVETPCRIIGIDLPDDLAKAIMLLAKRP
jgi:CMP-2-keto-3-deoxyoctulosonic acid synthetase